LGVKTEIGQLDELRKALKVEGSSSIPTARVLRRLLPRIEQELAKGYMHRQVHLVLVEQGIEMTFAYYQLTLHRIRNSAATRADGKSNLPSAPAPPPSQAAPSTAIAKTNETKRGPFKWDTRSKLNW
jgi:hypothetical protein